MKMDQKIDDKSRIRLMLLIVILATIPCYFLGLILLWGMGNINESAAITILRPLQIGYGLANPAIVSFISYGTMK